MNGAVNEISKIGNQEQDRNFRRNKDFESIISCVRLKARPSEDRKLCWNSSERVTLESPTRRDTPKHGTQSTERRAQSEERRAKSGKPYKMPYKGAAITAA